MKRTIAKIAILVIAIVVPLFVTFCINPLSFIDLNDSTASSKSGSMMVVLDSSASRTVRTVTAEVPAGISVWSVSLSRADGTGATRSASGASSSLGVDGLVPGAWNLSARGENASGVTVLSGSASGIEISAGQTTTVTVPLSFAQTGTGGFSLTVSFPASTGIDFASAAIDGSPLTPAISTVSDPRTAIFAASNMAIGTYSLSFALRRGGAAGTVAGSFVEALTIYPGLVSDRWISSDGSLSTIWNLTDASLFLSNSFLAGLTASSGTLAFSSGDFAPTLQSDSSVVSFVPAASVAGQLLEYSSDGAAWTPVQSGSSTPAVPLSGSFQIRVTSPDRGSIHTYLISLTRVFTIAYNANNATPSAHGVSVNAGSAHTVLAIGDTGFAVPHQDGIALRFGGWNTARDGSGTQYAAGSSINPVSSNVSLFARWSILGGVGPASGYVFYDKGSYSNGWRYLEVYNPAGADTAQDFSALTGISYGTLAASGAGKKNTALVFAKSNSGISAACEAFSANGFGDWFLPSSADLECIRTNLVVGCGLGGFAADNDYATSTEADASNIVAENMSTGVISDRAKKLSALYWRPVRAFAGTSATFIIVYDENSGTGSIPGSGVSFYPAGTTVAVASGAGLTKGTDIFAGWNTESGGTGTPYEGTGLASIILLDDTILYAQWRIPTVQDVINSVSAGGLVTPPGSFTANDLLAIGDAIYASSGPSVQLNLSNLAFDTFPVGTFTGCVKLTSVILPNSVTTVLNNCFSGCTALASVTLGNAVATIEEGAFKDCTALVSISLPATVMHISNNAFSGSGLVVTGGTLTCAATAPPALGNNAFGSNPVPGLSLKVPAASVAAYKSAPEWSNYADHISGY